MSYLQPLSAPRTHSQGQPLEKLLLLARGLSPSRTALNRDIVSFVPKPGKCLSHPGAAVEISESSADGLTTRTARKNANRVPIKDMKIKKASSKPVISIQWVGVEGHFKRPLGWCICQTNVWSLGMFYKFTGLI